MTTFPVVVIRFKHSTFFQNFTGNTDGINIVTNTLDPPTKTKFIRFYPTSFERNPAMRVDVHGIRTG